MLLELEATVNFFTAHVDRLYFNIIYKTLDATLALLHSFHSTQE